MRYSRGVADPSPERRCGSCSLCCRVLRVDPLRKLGGISCVHQREGTAAPCGVHGLPERPALCGAYRCAWLQGRFEETDRPDRLGAVLDLTTRAGLPVLRIQEAAPGAFDRSIRLQEIAASCRETMEVRITDADDVLNADRPARVLLPQGEEHRVTGERSVVLRDGEVVAERRLPLLDRWIRRGSLAWMGWRLRHYRGPAPPT